jgi:energy-coupling factor transporter ATP-binding protein EcfA2
MMRLLRELADGSRSVIIVTHATANLALCDDVVVIGRGGHLCFKGAPEDALAFFGVERYDDIYLALEDRPAAEWARRFRGGRPPEADEDDAAPAPAAADAKKRAPRGQSAGHQFRVLAARYLRVFQRDRRNVLILLGQVPLIAAALFALFDAGVFSGDRQADNAAQLVFMLVTVMIWLGAIDSAREIIKERSILARETAAGLRLDAYVLSKVAVLGGLVALQLAVFAGIVLATRPLHETPARYAALVGALLLTALIAVGLGLLISALARSQDQATSFVPLLLIPQLFFAGAIIPVPKMSEATARISDFVFARWSYGVSGAAADLHSRLLERYGGRSVYGSFFDASMLHGFVVLGAFAVAAYVLVYALLQRRAG